MSSSPTRSPFPPSVAGAGGGGGRPADAKAAVGELLSELEATRREYAKLSIQLSQVDAALQQGKELNAQHTETISELEALIVAKDEEHRTAMREAEDRYITKDAALAHRTRHLELEVQRLQAENEHMSKIEADNRTLRENTLDLQATIEKLQIVSEDLRQRTRDGAGGAAFEDMEKEFQKKLAAAEKKFRAEAYRALSEEAKIALQGNDHLQTVLKRQNDSIELVLERCKALEQSHSLMQSQQDRSSLEMEQQLREVSRLTKALEETRAKNQQLDEAMRQRRVERASLELLFVEYEAARKKLAKAEEKARRASRESERWKNRAVQLTQELNDEQREIAERRLLQLQAMSDTVETNAIRDEYRSDVRERIQAKQQLGSLAYQFANSNANNSHFNSAQPMIDNPYAYVGTSQTGGPNSRTALLTERSSGGGTVKPVDILAIWSKKYDDGFHQNPEANASGFDPITTAEAERIMEGIRNGVSPLALTALKQQEGEGAAKGEEAEDSQRGSGGHPTPIHGGSLITARPSESGLVPTSSSTYVPTSGRRAPGAAAAGGSGAGNISVGSSALIHSGRRSHGGVEGQRLPSLMDSTVAKGSIGLSLSGVSSSLSAPPVGTRDALAAEKDKGLSVLSQSHALHISAGTTARLPPSYQNSHRALSSQPQKGKGTNSSSSLVSSIGRVSPIPPGGGAASQQPKRSGSALGARGPLHIVTNSGDLKVVAPTEPLTRGHGIAHPNPPMVSPSTKAELNESQSLVPKSKKIVP